MSSFDTTYPGVAIVVGAASGIGRATAKLFAHRGCARLVVGDQDQDGLVETQGQIQQESTHCEVKAVVIDVTSEESVSSFFSEAVSTFGRIDYACNLAGILRAGSSPDISAAEFDKLHAVNSRGMWLCQRAELTQMLKQEPLQHSDSPHAPRGAIGNVASMAGLLSHRGFPAYCATKHMILGFTRADALEYASQGIRINAVCPGVVATPMLGELFAPGGANEDDLKRRIAMGRHGTPEEVAEALLWLTSSRASYVTGTTLAINGGQAGG